jgi:hypothetical protein
VADPVPAQGVYPAHPQVLGGVEVGIGEEVVPLGRGALVIADEKGDPPLPLVEEDLVPGKAGNPVRPDDDLGREVEGVDLGDFFGMELIDEVLGHELSHVADAGETLDEDLGAPRLLPEPVDLYLVHPRTLLRSLPLGSPGENRAGWAVAAGPPQAGQTGERV